MKKTLILINLLVLLFSCANTSQVKQNDRRIAQEHVQCGNGFEAVIEKIKKTQSCYEAISYARSCAYGSSIDSEFVRQASQVCEKDLKNMNNTDRELNDKLLARCGQLCDSIDKGSMCISNIAFCKLNVVEFFYPFYHSDEPL